MVANVELKAILSAVDRVSPVLKQVNTMTTATRKHLTDMANSVGHLTGKLGVPAGIVSGIAAGFGIGAIKKAVVGFAEMSESTIQNARAVGVTTDQYQEMAMVAKQANVPVEGLAKGMRKLTNGIGDAVTGKNKDLAGLFKFLHISLKDGNGQIKNSAALMPELANAWNKFDGKPIFQAKMAMALFGEQWGEVAPLLAQGAEGFDEVQERIKKFGGVISKDDLEQGRLLAKSFRDLEFATKGFSGVFARELVPVVREATDQFANWIKENKKPIGEEAKKFAKELGAALKEIDWKGLKEGAMGTVDSIRWVIEACGGGKNAMIALAVVMNLQTISAAVSLAGTFVKLGASVLGFAVTSAPKAVEALGKMNAAMLTANYAGAIPLLATLGKIALVAGVAYAAWEAGSWINDKINAGITQSTGGKNTSLGGVVFDWLHPNAGPDLSPAPLRPGGGVPGSPLLPQAQRPSLAAPMPAQKTDVGVTVKIVFDNAPPGLRVDDVRNTNPGVSMRVDVGERSFARNPWGG